MKAYPYAIAANCTLRLWRGRAALCLTRSCLTGFTNFFKVLGDKTRTGIVCALDGNELCVCDLAALLGMTKSAISHQLAYLKNAKLVKFRREGKNVFYSLDDDHVQSVVEMAVEHLNHR